MGVTPLELARAYATLGDRGSYKDYTTIRRIDDSQGRTLYEAQPMKEQVISEETAFIVNKILQSAADTGGTAHRLKGLNVAAKTGTVQLPPQLSIKILMDLNNFGWLPTILSILLLWMEFDKRSTENYLPRCIWRTYTTVVKM